MTLLGQSPSAAAAIESAVPAACEIHIAQALQRHPRYQAFFSSVLYGQESAARFALRSRGQLLSDADAPSLHALCLIAQERLEHEDAVEIYQVSDDDSSFRLQASAPTIIALGEELYDHVDNRALLAYFGASLGFSICYAPSTTVGEIYRRGVEIVRRTDESDVHTLFQQLNFLTMVSADRCALLAARDLDAVLRLILTQHTGLYAQARVWDTKGFRAQCDHSVRAYQALEDDTTLSDEARCEELANMPQGALERRVFALSLFAESTLYAELAGLQPAADALEAEELDAAIERLIGYQTMDDAYALSFEQSDPPPEVYECALACSVLVALADDVVAAEELERLELVFASRIPDWRSYLDYDIAIERFYQSSPIIAAGGAEAVTILFNILYLIASSDGHVDEQEIGIILGIGQHFNMEQRFRSMLFASLSARNDVDALEHLSSSEALPIPALPSHVETKEAFDAFLGGIQRRGQATLSIQRLVSLLGRTSFTPEIAQQVDRACARHDIDVSPPILEADSTSTLHFRANQPQQEARAESPSDLTTAALVSAVRRMREQLVSGDGRSPSVRLRETKNGRSFDLKRLDAISTGAAERALALLLNGRTAKLYDAGKSSRQPDVHAIHKELRDIGRANQSRYEESGAQDLYFGYPFLTGVVGSYLIRAPLVLYPIELRGDDRGEKSFTARARSNEDPIVNQSLLRLVFHKKGMVFSDDLSDELDALAADPAAGAEAIREKLTSLGLVGIERATELQSVRIVRDEFEGSVDFLEYEPIAVLGLFPQSNSDLLQDYDELIQELSEEGADPAKLFAAARFLLPEGFQGSTASLQTSARTSAPFPVVLADPKQRKVIRKVANSPATVIDGPPGTGKSQVIVNLIADALARGERVAVVCEKRAAIDVVSQRLDALGLRDTVALVHDIHDDRKALYKQINDRLELGTTFAPPTSELTEAKEQLDRVTTKLLQRNQLLAEPVATLGLSVGQFFTFYSGIQTTAKPLSLADPDFASLAQLSRKSFDRLFEVFNELRRHPQLWEPGSLWRSPDGVAPRPSLAGDEAAFEDIDGALERVTGAARHFEGARDAGQAADLPILTLQESGPAMRWLASQEGTLRSGDDYRMLQRLVGRPVTGDKAPMIQDLVASVDRRQDSLQVYPQRVHASASPRFMHALDQLIVLTTRWYRFFLARWWVARKHYKNEVSSVWSEVSETPISPGVLQDVQHRIAASKFWDDSERTFASIGHPELLPAHYSDVPPILNQVIHVAPFAEGLANQRGALEPVGSLDFEQHQDHQAWLETNRAQLRVVGAWEDLRATAKLVQQHFPRFSDAPTSSDSTELAAAFRRDREMLRHVDQLLDEAQAQLPNAAALFDQWLEASDERGDDALYQSLVVTWANAWRQRLEKDFPRTSRLGSLADDSQVQVLTETLRKVEEELGELEVENILAQVGRSRLMREPKAEYRARRTPTQRLVEEIMRETRKKRMVMPLRRFTRTYAPSGLLDILPVWLLSPETMSILFPRQQLFDVVIFDEASQCRVEDGFPALMRAKRMVVTGDEKQMPPSSYFTSSASDDELLPIDDDSSDAAAMRDILSSESLLTLARTRVPHAGLQWHYRCHDESLIAFSNHSMYQGQLLTIPSTSASTAQSPLRWIHVEDGHYEKGVNHPEAERVVTLLCEIFSQKEPPTVGIVSFNMVQRRAIMDAIDERVISDDRFAEQWAEQSQRPLEDRPFVKNLEQVQGDERDAIIFSLGHSPVARVRKGVPTGETYVPARFGPLGQRGGERRLNVAISRAKRETYIVASFDPTQLNVRTAKHDGPRLFKKFLEFAYLKSKGQHRDAQYILDQVREEPEDRTKAVASLPFPDFNPLQSQIETALDQAGIPFEANVGSSEFRVPIAILDPKNPETYKLALLLDDHSEVLEPSDVYVQQHRVLESRGWKAMHLNAATWLQRPDEILAQIEALVPGASGATSSEHYLQHLSDRKARIQRDADHRRDHAGQIVDVQAVRDELEDELPTWALQIPDAMYRRALLELEEKHLLTSTELLNLVGGPRRARTFIAQLEAWGPSLPFTAAAGDDGAVRVILAR